jgi:hypothetical protein
MGIKRLLAAAALAGLAQPAAAESSRMSRLADSNLLALLTKDGDWEVMVHGTGIEYTCVQCNGAVHARLEVIAPFFTADYNTYRERYLAERKLACADLVVENAGRCIGTRETSMRGSALKGFHSIHEVNGQTVVEITFLYHNGYFGPVTGPELIKTTIIADSADAIPSHLVETLRGHMARLTVFW